MMPTAVTNVVNHLSLVFCVGLYIDILSIIQIIAAVFSPAQREEGFDLYDEWKDYTF